MLVLEFLVKKVTQQLSSLIMLFLNLNTWEDWCSGMERSLVTIYPATFIGASLKLVWILHPSSSCRWTTAFQVSKLCKVFCSGLTMFFWLTMQVPGMSLIRPLAFAIMAGTTSRTYHSRCLTITYTIVKNKKSSTDTLSPKSSDPSLLER